MQQAVRDINKNPNLTPTEKAAQIHQLFAQQRSALLAPPATSSSASSSSSSSQGCKHYKRQCDIHTPCCDRFFACRICHDEQSDAAHAALVRSSTQQMRCRGCGTVQPVASQCVNAKCTSFQSTWYFCAPCRLWSNDETKPIFHCDGCGICRVGDKAAHWHCDRCRLCYPIQGMPQSEHHCQASAADDTCPVCAEYMHTSTKSVSLMACGHVIHGHCLKELYKQSISTCPKCRKSLHRDGEFELALRQEIDRTPMPTEYAHHQCEILCNDCEEKGMIVPFHFYGLQCEHCRSFNTSIVRNIREGPQQQQEEEEEEDDDKEDNE